MPAHHIRLVVVTTVASLALALMGCAPEGEPPDAGTPTPEPTPTPTVTLTAEPGRDLTEQCTNPDGFAVSYPQGWLTNGDALDDLPPCSLFDPTAIELDETMHVPEGIAVFIRVDAVSFDVVDPDDEFEQELGREELTVDGQDAIRRESVATGQGLRPEGMRTTAYRVDLGQRTLIATTHDAGGPAYRTKQQVLDAMVKTLELEDAETTEGAWEPMPDAPIEPRTNHTLTRTDDQVIAWGGGDADMVAADGAAWDLQAEEWAEVSEAPIEARWAHEAVWTGEELIVWGGSAGPDHLAECYTDGARYHPATGEWQAIPPAPGERRCGATAVWTDDELVVFGGHDADGPPRPDDRHNDGVAYDPAADEWRTVPAAPLAPRSGALSAWTGTEMVVVGGHTEGPDDGFDYLSDGAAYDPDTDAWRPIADAPLPPWSGGTALWVDDEMMLFGGQDPEATADTQRTDAAAYDPDEDAWRTLTDLPASMGFDPPAVWTGSVVYVVGGDLEDPDAPMFLAYVPDEDDWVERPDPPGGARMNHEVAWTGAELVVWGGDAAEGPAPGAVWQPPTG